MQVDFVLCLASRHACFFVISSSDFAIRLSEQVAELSRQLTACQVSETQWKFRQEGEMKQHLQCMEKSDRQIQSLQKQLRFMVDQEAQAKQQLQEHQTASVAKIVRDIL